MSTRKVKRNPKALSRRHRSPGRPAGSKPMKFGYGNVRRPQARP